MSHATPYQRMMLVLAGVSPPSRIVLPRIELSPGVAVFQFSQHEIAPPVPPPLELGLVRPFEPRRFWNQCKTEAEHKKLKATRKTKRLARRKNRR